ncbi:Cyclin-dependent kinases regulatory subunit 2 [Nowakowskiella sp. JEL0407]|nr:Cyclin-dependent kinases regulatory subunit 2 [Nowakowskiella sp. JEL0407]
MARKRKRVQEVHDKHVTSSPSEDSVVDENTSQDTTNLPVQKKLAQKISASTAPLVTVPSSDSTANVDSLLEGSTLDEDSQPTANTTTIINREKVLIDITNAQPPEQSESQQVSTNAEEESQEEIERKIKEKKEKRLRDLEMYYEQEYNKMVKSYPTIKWHLAPQRSFARPNEICRLLKAIDYNNEYCDDYYKYRNIKLPKQLLIAMPDRFRVRKLFTEAEVRSFGIVQSGGWEHYAFHRPEPHILLFRKLLSVVEEQAKAAKQMQQAAAGEEEEVEEEKNQQIDSAVVIDGGNEVEQDVEEYEEEDENVEENVQEEDEEVTEVIEDSNSETDTELEYLNTQQEIEELENQQPKIAPPTRLNKKHSGTNFLRSVSPELEENIKDWTLSLTQMRNSIKKLTSTTPVSANLPTSTENPYASSSLAALSDTFSMMSNEKELLETVQTLRMDDEDANEDWDREYVDSYQRVLEATSQMIYLLAIKWDGVRRVRQVVGSGGRVDENADEEEEDEQKEEEELVEADEVLEVDEEEQQEEEYDGEAEYESEEEQEREDAGVEVGYETEEDPENEYEGEDKENFETDAVENNMKEYIDYESSDGELVVYVEDSEEEGQH